MFRHSLTRPAAWYQALWLRPHRHTESIRAPKMRAHVCPDIHLLSARHMMHVSQHAGTHIRACTLQLLSSRHPPLPPILKGKRTAFRPSLQEAGADGLSLDLYQDDALCSSTSLNSTVPDRAAFFLTRVTAPLARPDPVGDGPPPVGTDGLFVARP